MAGMASARSRGSRPGRPTVMTPDRIATARTLAAAGTPVTRIAATLGVGRASVYRALAEQRGRRMTSPWAHGAHLFVDESKAGDYLMVAAVMLPADLVTARAFARSLVYKGQPRLHMKKESDARESRSPRQSSPPVYGPWCTGRLIPLSTNWSRVRRASMSWSKTPPAATRTAWCWNEMTRWRSGTTSS